jgi:arginyl-tRNA synthetase
MNLFAEIETQIRHSLQALQARGALPDGLPLERVGVEPPRDASH